MLDSSSPSSFFCPAAAAAGLRLLTAPEGGGREGGREGGRKGGREGGREGGRGRRGERVREVDTRDMTALPVDILTP